MHKWQEASTHRPNVDIVKAVDTAVFFFLLIYKDIKIELKDDVSAYLGSCYGEVNSYLEFIISELLCKFRLHK